MTEHQLRQIAERTRERYQSERGITTTPWHGIDKQDRDAWIAAVEFVVSEVRSSLEAERETILEATK